MSNEGSVDSTVAIKLLLEGKNHQRFIDVISQQPQSSLPPRPELRSDVVHRGYASFFHFAGDPPVKGRRINDDGEVRLAFIGFLDQVVEQAVDLWQVAEDFRDADDRQIFGVGHRLASGGAHAVPAYPKKIQRMLAPAQSLNQLRAVHFPRGF